VSSQPTTTLEFGKVSADTFEKTIFPRLGRSRPHEVLVGPRNGVDVGIVSLGNGLVMATTTDPLWVMPEVGWERAGWFAIQIIASDAVTSGLEPKYITLDLNLPADLSSSDFEILWDVIHRACDNIGLAVISGHTGRYAGCAFPTIGAGTVIAIGSEKSYITPEMARPGDVVIVTKGAALETTAHFGVTFPDRIRAACGEAIAKEAEALYWQMSVVKDATVAASVGLRENGVTTMHDATERGVWGGLYEIAQASHVGMVIHKEMIPIPPCVRAVCELFQIDPYPVSSEGTLLLTCRPNKANDVITRLSDNEIAASIVGEIVPREHGIHYLENGKQYELTYPESDPFWEKFTAECERV